MLLVEKIGDEIRITNEFCFVGDYLVESISHRGFVNQKYRKINMLNLKEFSFVEPYYVVLGLMGLSREETQKNIIASKLSLINTDGFISGSNIKIKRNQTPAFLDPSVYQVLSFVELVFHSDEGDRRLFFFDVDTNELLNIDRSVNAVKKIESPAILETANTSSDFTLFRAVGKRISNNAIPFFATNITALVAIPSLMLYLELINIVFFASFIFLLFFNVSSFFSILNSSASRRLLLNPFLSYFCLSKKEFLSIFKKGGLL